MRRIYKQPIQTISFLFFFFYTCFAFLSLICLEGDSDILKWSLILLGTAECAYLSAELDSRDKQP